MPSNYETQTTQFLVSKINGMITDYESGVYLNNDPIQSLDAMVKLCFQIRSLVDKGTVGYVNP